MASWASAMVMLREGAEPTFQLVCRDKNRLAIQADILGISSLGVRNILCLSGDHQSLGNHPGAGGVFDLDSMGLIDLCNRIAPDAGKC